MKKRNLFKILLILILIIFTWFIYSKYFKKSNDLLSVITNTTDTINITDPADTKTAIEEEVIYNSNIIKDIIASNVINDSIIIMIVFLLITFLCIK